MTKKLIDTVTAVGLLIFVFLTLQVGLRLLVFHR